MLLRRYDQCYIATAVHSEYWDNVNKNIKCYDQAMLTWNTKYCERCFTNYSCKTCTNVVYCLRGLNTGLSEYTRIVDDKILYQVSYMLISNDDVGLVCDNNVAAYTLETYSIPLLSILKHNSINDAKLINARLINTLSCLFQCGLNADICGIIIMNVILLL